MLMYCKSVGVMCSSKSDIRAEPERSQSPVRIDHTSSLTAPTASSSPRLKRSSSFSVVRATMLLLIVLIV